MKKPSAYPASFSHSLLPVSALCAAMLLPASVLAQAAGSDADREETSSATTSSSAMDAPKVDDDSREFIHDAAKLGLMEVRLSQLALERTDNAKVRVCAQAIINDHQRANAELAVLANQRGIMLPLDTAAASLRMSGPASGSASSSASTTASGSASTDTRGATAATDSTTAMGSTRASAEETGKMLDEIQQAVDRLSRSSGAEFDRAYIAEMVRGHEKAIDLFQEQAEETSQPELARHAEKTLPTLREHLSRAEAVQKSLEN